MANRRCARCGSISFRADRSLGGRLVCSHCGFPADQRARSSGSGGQLKGINQRGGGLWFWLLLAVIALVAVLLFQSA